MSESMIRIPKLLLATAISLFLISMIVSCSDLTPAVVPSPTPSPTQTSSQVTEPVPPAPTQSSIPEPTPTPPPPPIPPATPPPAPAEFIVTSLAVTPIVAEPGLPVTVEVRVMNIGGTQGSDRLALIVNGAEEEIRDVRVAPRITETITFTLIKDASGMYEIKAAGLTEILRVKQVGAYPRLGNNYVQSFWQIEPAKLRTLARWDTIAVPYNVYRYAPEAIRQIKKLNPQIKILAWIEYGLCDYWDLQSMQLSNESWFLHYADTPGNPRPPEQRRANRIEGWPGMNPASGWSTYLPDYVHDNIMSTGLFDGVHYDCIFENLWLQNIDINNDGVADTSDVINREYNNGTTQLLKLTRELLGPEAIIIGNPGDQWSANSLYWDYANGLYQENTLGKETWSSHNFSKIWDIYQRNMQKPTPPSRISWIAADVDNKEYDQDITPDLTASELQKVRYGLAITLLDNGYFCFDKGHSHKELWWFPEYDANLGLAKGKAQQRSDGTWTREFENGVVIVNPTGSVSMISFATTYQDISTGNKSTSFSVQPQDGRIFLLAH